MKCICRYMTARTFPKSIGFGIWKCGREKKFYVWDLLTIFMEWNWIIFDSMDVIYGIIRILNLQPLSLISFQLFVLTFFTFNLFVTKIWNALKKKFCVYDNASFYAIITKSTAFNRLLLHICERAMHAVAFLWMNGDDLLYIQLELVFPSFCHT